MTEAKVHKYEAVTVTGHKVSMVPMQVDGAKCIGLSISGTGIACFDIGAINQVLKAWRNFTDGELG